MMWKIIGLMLIAPAFILLIAGIVALIAQDVPVFLVFAILVLLIVGIIVFLNNLNKK